MPEQFYTRTDCTVNQQLTKPLRSRLRDDLGYLSTMAQASRSMAYYLLTACVIGGALGVLHWAILGS
jgi:hypothetical protein